MKYILLFLAIGLLFGQAESLLNIVSSILNSLLEKPERNDWAGVKKCYEENLKIFKKYPDPPLYDIGQTVITSFKTHFEKLINYTKSDSKIISEMSTALLEALSLLSKLGVSARYSLYQNKKITPKLFLAYREIVNDLAPYIGELTTAVNDILTELEELFGKLFEQYEKRFSLRGDIIDFEPIMKSGQHLINTICLIVKTAMNDRESIADDTYVAILILIFISNDSLMAIQGADVTIASVVYSETRQVSNVHLALLQPLDPIIQSIADVITLSTELEIPDSVRFILISVSEHSSSFNATLIDALGPLESALITVPHIQENLLRNLLN